MQFLTFFSGSKASTNCEVVPDKIWLTTDAKFAGIEQEIAALSNSGTVAILLVAHFPDVLNRLTALQIESTIPLQATLAQNLSPDLAASLKLDREAKIDVIVAERHPLPSVDDCLHDFAKGFAFHCRFTHHLSLDDPVMQVFTSRWARSVLKIVGMTEDEPIESRMASHGMRRAQRRIESKSHLSRDANSAAEWLQKNYPEI